MAPRLFEEPLFVPMKTTTPQTTSLGTIDIARNIGTEFGETFTRGKEEQLPFSRGLTALFEGRGIQEAGQEFGRGLQKAITTPLSSEELVNVAIGATSPLSSQSPRIFKGFKDLSTKVLERLKGKAITSKQEILDFTNMPELKQAERNLIRRIAEGEPDRILVQEFANKVEAELLPLKLGRVSRVVREQPSVARTQANRYENIALPYEQRGAVANYGERIYESPIKTSAGNVHFSEVSYPNYFAHTRIEDLATEHLRADTTGKILKEPKRTEPIRRIIELQSDLFQKGRLEAEASISATGRLELRERGTTLVPASEKIRNARTAEIAKLEPYRNIWHERIIREEVKQAAKDDKTKLQFPTGKTAMKIEGLGQTEHHFAEVRGDRFVNIENGQRAVRPETLKTGMELTDSTMDRGNRWIITDILGDGKFKAVQKTYVDRYGLEHSRIDQYKETFDISGKIDINNPIYRFYEKEVGKFLQNKFGAKMITDPQGVEWWEVNISKEAKKLPVEAFAIMPFLFPRRKQESKEPLFIKQ